MMPIGDGVAVLGSGSGYVFRPVLPRYFAGLYDMHMRYVRECTSNLPCALWASTLDEWAEVPRPTWIHPEISSANLAGNLFRAFLCFLLGQWFYQHRPRHFDGNWKRLKIEI